LLVAVNKERGSEITRKNWNTVDIQQKRKNFKPESTEIKKAHQNKAFCCAKYKTSEISENHL
jgi:hypothetical protein